MPSNQTSRHLPLFVLLLHLLVATLLLISTNASVHTTSSSFESNASGNEIEAHNHFIQGESELPQPGSPQAYPNPHDSDEGPKTVSIKREDGISNSAKGTVSTQDGSRVTISPSHVDFQDRPMSIPAVKIVVVSNQHESEEFVITSITSDSSSFHTSLFKPITVFPLSNVSLEIVFLPRSTGTVESSVMIHTSLPGKPNFVLQVSGRGTPNPYKLSPFIGVKVPVGVVYEPAIVLYNPHYELLSVKEIYTSSGFLHLQLPTEARNFSSSTDSHALMQVTSVNGGTETRRLRFWDIRPHERLAVIKLRFSSTKTGKFQGFVNIKTNFDNLIIPVDVSVVSGAVHKTPEELDFGIITLQEHKTLNFSLLNSGFSVLQVTDMHMTGTSDPNLDFNFVPAILPPRQDVFVASLTYHGRSEGTFRGKLLLRTNDTGPVFSRMDIPFRVRVLSGYLAYHSTQTTFASFDSKVSRNKKTKDSTQLEPVVQELVLTNKFSVPLVLFSAEIDDIQLRLVDFVPSQQAEPGESWPALKIEFRPTTSHLLFTTHLHLMTNASSITIPLHIYHGKLAYSLPAEAHRYSVGPLAAASEESLSTSAAPHTSGTMVQVNKHNFEVQSLQLAFGIIPVNEVQTLTLNVTNHNPVKLSLLGLWTDIEGLNLKLESVWNSQGYRSIANVAFKPHKPAAYDPKSPPATTTSAPTSRSSSSSKQTDNKKAPKSKSAPNLTKETKPALHQSGPEPFEISPGHSALFSLELTSTKEATVQGFIYFCTPHERSAINVTFQSLAGSLELTPERFVFDPDLNSDLPLYLEHTYSHSITITSMSSDDARVQVNMPRTSASSIGSQDERHLWLRPAKKTAFGTLSFKPLTGHKSATELESSVSSTTSAKELLSSTLPDVLDESDAQNLFSTVDLSPQLRQNDIRATVTVKTDLKTTHNFPVRVQRWRPSFVKKSDSYVDGKIDFGLAEVQVGEKLQKVTVHNPTLSAVVVRLQFSSEAQLLPASASSTTTKQSCFGSFEFAKGAISSAVVQPGETLILGPIAFVPQLEGQCSSTLYVRNNLTTIEPIVIIGQGGGGQLAFSTSASAITSEDIMNRNLQKSSPRFASSANVAMADIEREVESENEHEHPIQQLLFEVSDAALSECAENEESKSSTSSKTTSSASDRKQSPKASSDASSKRKEWAPPVFTQPLFVFNRGNLPVHIDRVFIVSSSDAQSSLLSKEGTFASSWTAKHSSTNSAGGFRIMSSKDVAGTVLWPGAKRVVDISYSPDFSAAVSEYDLIMTTNSSRVFRFPLKGVVSENLHAQCVKKFAKPISTSKSSLWGLRSGLILVASIIVIGMAVERRWRAKQDSVDLPLSNGTSLSHGKDSVTPMKPVDDTIAHEGSGRNQTTDDVENASKTSPSRSAQGSKKKDKQDGSKNQDVKATVNGEQPPTKTKRRNSATASDKKDQVATAVVLSPPTPTSNGASVQDVPLAGQPSSSTQTESAGQASSPEISVANATAPVLAIAPTPTHATPSTSTSTPTQTGTKKKDKKDKKEANAKLAETSLKKDVVPSKSTEVPEKKRKKSLGATSSSTIVVEENKEAPRPRSTSPERRSVDAAPTSPKREQSQSPQSTDQISTSPPNQRTTPTLVPAKRPSSKPLPKYARKDGLGKDAPVSPASPPSGPTTAIPPLATSPPQSQTQRSAPSVTAVAATSTASVPATTTQAPSVTAKESRKNRQSNKEYKPKQQPPTEQQPSAATTKQTAPSSAQPSDSHAGTSLSFQPVTFGWGMPLPSAPPGLAAVPSSTSNTVPLFVPPHGTRAHPFSSPLFDPSAPTPSASGAPLPSAGALSANRYDSGRRVPNPSFPVPLSTGNIPSLSFDFSTAPTFDTSIRGSPSNVGASGSVLSATRMPTRGGLSRENSSTPPPSSSASGLMTPPNVRLYNPMSPGTGSVENLLASLRDPDLSGSESGSVSGTPRDFSSFLGASTGSLTNILDGVSNTGQPHSHQHQHPLDSAQSDSSDPWNSVTAPNSIWNAPTSDRAVEENASNLYMLGLGPFAGSVSRGRDSFFFPHAPLHPGQHHGSHQIPPGQPSSGLPLSTTSAFSSSELSSSVDSPNTFSYSPLLSDSDMWNSRFGNH